MTIGLKNFRYLFHKSHGSILQIRSTFEFLINALENGSSGKFLPEAYPGPIGLKDTYFRNRGIQYTVWSKLLQETLGDLPKVPTKVSNVKYILLKTNLCHA